MALGQQLLDSGGPKHWDVFLHAFGEWIDSDLQRVWVCVLRPLGRIWLRSLLAISTWPLLLLLLVDERLHRDRRLEVHPQPCIGM